MAIEVTVPKFGESVSEVVLVQWHKRTGDLVRRDEPLVEVETEKATENIVAPSDGTLTITAEAGKRVPVGGSVGRIDASAAAPPEPSGKTAESRPASARSHAAAVAREPAAPPMSPAARVLVAEKQIAPSDITPSGRGGVILKEDVISHLEKTPAVDGPARSRNDQPVADRTESRQKMSPLRRRIAQRLVASQQATASLTTFNEADMSAVIDLRSRYKDKFEKKHGVALGFMSFFVKAAVEALRAFPVVNARMDGEDIVYHQYYDIGVAVSTERGLMVPVLRDCGRLSFADIERAIGDLARRAREGKIKPDDLSGGTFTITNGGVFGSMMSTPILNPPQSGILGMHTIQKRPVALGEQVVIRPMMYLALTYDHRLIDGREAVQFLVRVKECVENPGAMLLDI